MDFNELLLKSLSLICEKQHAAVSFHSLRVIRFNKDKVEFYYRPEDGGDLVLLYNSRLEQRRIVIGAGFVQKTDVLIW